MARTASRVRASAASVSPSSSRPRVAALRRAASSDTPQQRVRARGLDQRDAAVHHALLDQLAVPEVDHRRLGEAADDLVRARDHEVGASERVREGRSSWKGRWAPQASSTTKGTPRAARPQPARPRPPPPRSTWARPRWRPRPRGFPRASARAPRESCGARCRARDRAPDPRRWGAADITRARRSCWSARCAGSRRCGPRARARAAAWFPLRGPVHEPPGPPRAGPPPRGALGLSEGRGLGAYVDPHVRAGMSSASVHSPSASTRPGSAPAPPCGQARGSGRARARQEGAQGVEVRRAGLGHGRRVYVPGFPAGGSSSGLVGSSSRPGSTRTAGARSPRRAAPPPARSGPWPAPRRPPSVPPPTEPARCRSPCRPRRPRPAGG